MRLAEDGTMILDREDWEKLLKESNERMLRFMNEKIDETNNRLMRSEMFTNGMIRERLLKFV